MPAAAARPQPRAHELFVGGEDERGIASVEEDLVCECISRDEYDGEDDD